MSYDAWKLAAPPDPGSREEGPCDRCHDRDPGRCEEIRYEIGDAPNITIASGGDCACACHDGARDDAARDAAVDAKIDEAIERRHGGEW